MRHIALIAIPISLGISGGCPALLEDESSLWLADVSNGQAVLEYYARDSGFETLPSTIWEVDLGTAQTQKVRNARRRFDFQVSGDCYVAEIPEDDDLNGSLVVGGRISTDREFTIVKRDVRLAGRYDRAVVLDGTRAVVRTPAGLLVYDLAAESELKTIAISDVLVEILAVGGDHALVVRDDVHTGDVLIVNLITGSIVTPPAPPDGFEPLYFDAIIRDGVIHTGAVRYSGGDPSPTEAAILRFSIEQSTWASLATFDLDERSLASAGAITVDGVSDEYVLASVTTFFTQAELVLIDTHNGAHSTVASRSALLGGFRGLLRDDRVYWIDANGFTDDAGWSLTSYDIASGTKQSRTLTIPLN